MARIDEIKIAEIRGQVNIVDVIASYIPLVKKGRNYMALCPFHQDSHPSMSISQDKQIYKCFVCGNGGNVFTFIQNYLQVSFIEAVLKTAEFANIDMSEYQYQKVEKRVDPKLQPLYVLHEEASKVYHYYVNTKVGLTAKEYLTRRHIDDDVIDTFKIGYAPEKSTLLSVYENQGIDPITMVESGLIVEGRILQDRFLNRLMFPLHDHDGRVVGFSGRILQKQDNAAKYVNSPESEIFIKGNILYNYFRVKESVRKAGYVIVCEGFMDVIAFYRAGIKNVVAIMGTALTPNHIQALQRLSNNVYLCLDGDKAGKVATEKSILLLEEKGLTVHVLPIEEGKDPDEILEKNGVEELHAIVKSPLTSMNFLLDYYMLFTNLNNYESRKEYVVKMSEKINTIADVIDREYYIEQLQLRSQFSKDIIHTMISKNPSNKVDDKNIYIPTKRTTPMYDRFTQAQRELLYYMLLDYNVARKYESDLGFMFDNSYNTIASYIVDYYRNNIVLEVADFINIIKDKHLVDIILDISQIQLPTLEGIQSNINADKYEVINDYINTIKEKAVEIQIEELTISLKHTQDDVSKAKILEEIISIRKRGKYEKEAN